MLSNIIFQVLLFATKIIFVSYVHFVQTSYMEFVALDSIVFTSCSKTSILLGRLEGTYNIAKIMLYPLTFVLMLEGFLKKKTSAKVAAS